MAKMHGVMWWVDRWRKSTAYTDMTAEEQGLYRNLLDEIWNREDHVIPDDHRILSRVSGDHEAWARCGEKVLKWMRRVDGGWTNDTALEVIHNSEVRAERQKRYRNKKRSEDRNATRNEVHNDADNEGHSPSPSPSPSPEQEQNTPPTPPPGGRRGLRSVETRPPTPEPYVPVEVLRCPDCERTAVVRQKQAFGTGWVCSKRREGCGQEFPVGEAALIKQLPPQQVEAVRRSVRRHERNRASPPGLPPPAPPPPDPEAEQAWAAIVEPLRALVDPHTFNTWFRGSRGLAIRGGELLVEAVNPAGARWQNENHAEATKRAAAQAGLKLSVRFVAAADVAQDLPAAARVG